ncbi:uncharacterized protein LOC143025247 [Oratosquilla oratoria]|uniref:uncharacterized protein LOC143025247 n=1 Tax=Oratosquilla oratoria TaxID=337810 RepID=UPI003F75825F
MDGGLISLPNARGKVRAKLANPLSTDRSYLTTLSAPSTSVYWSQQDTVTLIDLYRVQECLWNVKCFDYKNRDKRTAALKHIAQTISRSESHVKKKLASLRDQHQREMRLKATSQKSGAGSNYNAVKCYLLSKYGGNHGYRTVMNHSLPTSACGQPTSNHHRQPCGHLCGQSLRTLPGKGKV